jgi:hypothetical protein
MSPASLLVTALLSVPLLLNAAEPVTATLGIDNRIRIGTPAGELCSLHPVAADPDWSFAGQGMHDGRMLLRLGAGIVGDLGLSSTTDGGSAWWTFTAKDAVRFNCLAVSADFPAPILAGGTWTADGVSGSFPAVYGEMHLLSQPLRRLAVTTADGRSIVFAFPEPTPVLIQDNRRWGPDFSLRIGLQAGTLAAQPTYRLAMELSSPGGLRVTTDGPTVITAGDDWIPLRSELDIEPGSALDFSGNGFTSGPCGGKGRVIATPEGHFAFAGEPDVPQRFYGVNLCFSAQFLERTQADRLLDRLVRLGYNSVRIHHYEYRLTQEPWQTGLEWSAERLDQLDYLMAGCAKRGLWLTTDLYVSRPVSGAQVGLPGEKRDDFKVLVPVHEPAFADWKAFARKLLDRVNPHTGRRVADEPALAWISLINEGNPGNYWKEVLALPQWTAAWNRWLAERCADRPAIAGLLGDLKDTEDTAQGNVALPGALEGDAPRQRACQAFLADTELRMVARMRTFLRDELKCQALLTNQNGWTNHIADQRARTAYDYVDDHFYVDHPIFLDQDWRLPSRSGNVNPVREGAPGGRGNAIVRLWGKPFTISEYNYSGPGRFRGVGGILTGALASLQDWDALWRFAYAHEDRKQFEPAPITYFDLASDPLNQAADRAAVMLYLRRDLAPAPHRVAVVMTEEELRHPQSGVHVGNGPNWLAWITRLGSAVISDPGQVPADAIQIALGWSTPAKPGLAAYASDHAAVATLLRSRDVQVDDTVIRSETGELMIDPAHGVLCFDTPRTAGGYADPGQVIAARKAGVQIDGLTVGATVFVTSLDRLPIRSAPRLLLTHLTDLQNSGASYAEAARQTLIGWGGLPHVVRDGAAQVRIHLDAPEACSVWALSTSGRRLERVASTVIDGNLVIPVRVRAADGARMLYEITRQP